MTAPLTILAQDGEGYVLCVREGHRHHVLQLRRGDLNTVLLLRLCTDTPAPDHGVLRWTGVGARCARCVERLAQRYSTPEAAAPTTRLAQAEARLRNREVRQTLGEVRSAFRRLVGGVVESLPPGFTRRNPLYRRGDEFAPFGSEGFLYPLLGKEDARTLLGRLGRLAVALGTSLHAEIAAIERARHARDIEPD